MKTNKLSALDSALAALLVLPCLNQRITFDKRDRDRLLRFAYQVIPCLTDDEILTIYREPKVTADQARKFLLGRIGIELAVQAFRRTKVKEAESRDVDDAEIATITKLLCAEFKRDNNAAIKTICASAATTAGIAESRIKHVLYTYILPDGRHQGCEDMEKKHGGKIRRFNKTKQYLQYLVEYEDQ